MSEKTEKTGATIPSIVVKAIDREVARLSNAPGITMSRSAFISGAAEMRVRWREVRDETGEVIALVKPDVVGVVFTGVTARDPILKDGKDG